MLNPPLNQLQSQINSKYLIATTALNVHVN